MKRTINDVMTKEVVTVEPSTGYKDVLRVMTASVVSAVPVVDAAGRVIGIISQDDMLLKQEHDPAARHRTASARHRREHEKAAGTDARQLMTSPVITVSRGASLAAAARLMHDHHIKRLPVVDSEGALVGIVSRRDLLKVFMRSDEEIRHDVAHQVIERTLWLTPEEAEIRVEVKDGVVTLDGRIDRTSTANIIARLVHQIEGVVSVDNWLHPEADDSDVRPWTPPPRDVLPSGLRRP